MANRLNMVKVHAILALHAQGDSQRRIAEELDVHRETVGRVLQDSKPAKAPTGVSTLVDDPKPAKAPTGASTDVDDSKPARAPTGSGSQADAPEDT